MFLCPCMLRDRENFLRELSDKTARVRRVRIQELATHSLIYQPGIRLSKTLHCLTLTYSKPYWLRRSTSQQQWKVKALYSPIFFAELNPIPLVLLLFKSNASMFVKLIYGRQDVFLVRVLNETQRHQERNKTDEGKRVFTPYGPYSQGLYSSEVIFQLGTQFSRG